MADSRNNLLVHLRKGILSQSAEETEALASEMARLIPDDTVLALHGDLGVGKTTFIRGLARTWDITEPITSPTFNLYSVYEGSRQLIHLDAYRLADGSDLDTLMIEDFLRSPWCLAIEWPSRISDSLPSDTWQLYLEIKANGSHWIQLQT